MKLTRSASYAVGILLNVERGRSRGPKTAAQISKGAKFPPRFLYRVLRRLVDGGLLTGVSGPGGGYGLAKPARKISLLEIVTAVEGPQEATVLEPVSPQHRGAIQTINQVSSGAALYFNRELKKITLARLAKLPSTGRASRRSTNNRPARPAEGRGSRKKPPAQP